MYESDGHWPLSNSRWSDTIFEICANKSAHGPPISDLNASIGWGFQKSNDSKDELYWCTSCQHKQHQIPSVFFCVNWLIRAICWWYDLYFEFMWSDNSGLGQISVNQSMVSKPRTSAEVATWLCRLKIYDRTPPIIAGSGKARCKDGGYGWIRNANKEDDRDIACWVSIFTSRQFGHSYAVTCTVIFCMRCVADTVPFNEADWSGKLQVSDILESSLCRSGSDRRDTVALTKQAVNGRGYQLGHQTVQLSHVDDAKLNFAGIAYIQLHT